MWKRNASLTVEHPSESRPLSWLVLWKGVVRLSLPRSSSRTLSGGCLKRYWGNKSSTDYRRIYLMGNPLVWWTSTAALILYGITRATLVIRGKLHHNDGSKGEPHESTVLLYLNLPGQRSSRSTNHFAVS